MSKVRVAVAVPIDPDLVARMQSAHPEIEWLWQPELLPPRRHPADFAGVPGFQRSVADQAAYEALVDSADVLFGIPDTDPAALHRCALANSRLRWLHTMAAGGGAQVRAAELPAERLATMTVTTSAGVHGTGLAEFALLGLLAGLKDLPRLERDRHAHHWPDRAPVRQLRGAVILVLGAGGIGRRVAELAGAFGATAWGLAHHRSASLPGFDRVVDSGDLRAVLAEVDAVVACLPGTDATWHLVDADFLAALKPGAVVVNVGRGSVVDEQALWASLVDGQVGFAALDVFENEPLTADSPLWDCDRVLISPHTAALDEGEEERIVTLFLANLRRWLDGRDLQNVMTDEFY